jgi:hypothetical protein
VGDRTFIRWKGSNQLYLKGKWRESTTIWPWQQGNRFPARTRQMELPQGPQERPNWTDDHQRAEKVKLHKRLYHHLIRKRWLEFRRFVSAAKKKLGWKSHPIRDFKIKGKAFWSHGIQLGRKTSRRQYRAGIHYRSQYQLDWHGGCINIWRVLKLYRRQVWKQRIGRGSF